MGLQSLRPTRQPLQGPARPVTLPAAGSDLTHGMVCINDVAMALPQTAFQRRRGGEGWSLGRNWGQPAGGSTHGGDHRERDF